MGILLQAAKKTELMDACRQTITRSRAESRSEARGRLCAKPPVGDRGFASVVPTPQSPGIPRDRAGVRAFFDRPPPGLAAG